MPKFAIYKKNATIISGFISFASQNMSLSKATKAWKTRYYLLLTIFIWWLGALGYFYGFSYLQEQTIAAKEQEIQNEQKKIENFYQNTGLKEFLAVKKLETTRNHLPRSDHIEKILSILSKVKHVEEGRGNILLSDFKINLQELSLNGIVGNLKALYLAPGGSGFSVLDEFNQLEFLSDIAVRNYERNEDTRWFKFTLSAKVINDARTESRINQ